MLDTINAVKKVTEIESGQRLDQIAAQLFPEYSRARLQTWIKDGALTVDGEKRKPKEKIFSGTELILNVQLEAEGVYEAEEMELDIVYEDNDILVLNKPTNMVVHPAAGNWSGTLLNGILHHAPECAALPRAGIVHRLDKDTTGLMVVAKSLEAHADLVAQLHERSVGREYEAIASGVMTGGGSLETEIGRHPKNRQRMAVVKAGGKQAITHYRVLKRFANHTHIRVKLETGRTHQIRVHMAHLRHPLVGDITYAGRHKFPKGASEALLEALASFPRQALHAKRLELFHPITGQTMSWEVDLPADMQHLLDVVTSEDQA